MCTYRTYLGIPLSVLNAGRRRSASSIALFKKTLSPDKSKADKSPPNSLIVVWGIKKTKSYRKKIISRLLMDISLSYTIFIVKDNRNSWWNFIQQSVLNDFINLFAVYQSIKPSSNIKLIELINFFINLLAGTSTSETLDDFIDK